MAPSTTPPPAPTQVHKGLEGVVADETFISEVDGQRCQLIYRGYPIDELVGHTTYEEVSSLLFYNTLPTRDRLCAWTALLESSRALEPPLVSFLQGVPRTADTMAVLRTAVSLLGLYDPAAEDDSIDAIGAKGVRTIAAFPTIVAALGRLNTNQSPLAPQRGLSHAANFLYMLHGREPTTQQAQALDAYLILLADHGFNASTFTARTVTSTRSDYYSAISAAVGSLKGSLHGTANRKAMEMLMEVGGVDQVEAYVQKTLADHKRFMGFGHRVYKGEDPRAKHLKAFARTLGEASGDLTWLTLSTRLQDAVWKAKQLSINVDFYSASLLHYLGIPTELFTPMFACARIAGWSAHVIEQASNNRLIRPLASYLGPRDLRFIPLDQRA